MTMTLMIDMMTSTRRGIPKVPTCGRYQTHLPCSIFPAFNANGIIYDNTPWKPGSEADEQRAATDDGERKLNNLATRIMSNGVEVLVKDKNTDAKYEQRTVKLMHQSTLQPSYHARAAPKQTLLSSAVATVVRQQHISALLPLNKLLKHNYIIKTCMTTYTYLTTIIQNKRSAISTFDTIVSVVTTESLTNLYDTDDLSDFKPTKTKYMEVKTIQPSSPTKMYMSNFPKADKRIDSEENDDSPFDLIQPSEVSHTSCTTTSCSCSNTKTEELKTKYPNKDSSVISSYNIKSSKYGGLVDLRPTKKNQLDKKTQYGPYEYETSSQLAPTDRIVEKYTEVINDYSDEKDSGLLNGSELLTNEQAPAPSKINKVKNEPPEKAKPDKQKPNKNKFAADLLKLGTLGIKGLTQLAPVIEKMTGGFIKRQDTANKVTSTTVKPAVKLTAYNVNKRVDSDMESKHNNFPIYIPVDEMETSESQIVFTNATLHQNLAWAAEHKQPKAHIVPPKFIHESPLVNGGIPISPGEIITANSDVIVGKPAVGGPLTLAASGIKLQNPVGPPPIDSFVAANEQYLINEKPLSDQGIIDTKVDDSYDLRPPELPKMKPKPNRPLNAQRPSISIFGHQNKMPPRSPPAPHDQLMKTEHIKSTSMFLGNHGRPAFLDYIPSLAKPITTNTKPQVHFKPNTNNNKDVEIPDNSPSSSEIVNTQIRTEADYTVASNSETNKPFLVDIQPSRVANVLIPHGSSTALVFAGSSEPHKTGDYVDDPLPYPEPGYFGSFSIDAPKMTNVHNVAPNSNKQFTNPNLNRPQDHHKLNLPQFNEYPVRNDMKLKWTDNKRPGDYNKIPPPTSNQESHVQVGPQITSYNPDIFSPTNGDFDKYNQIKDDKSTDSKKIIDKEYENYLAVPPPPPKMIFNQESSYDKLKPYQQRPIVHTKPVQDMKVFLNIQHPVPQEQLPPKVTSEIYFAAQAPNNKPSPTYTIHIPPAADSFTNTYNKPINNVLSKPMNIDIKHGQTHFPVVPSPNIRNTSQITPNDNEKENTYTVTLNTATNVASNIGEVSQVIGSSIPVPIGSTNIGLNTDIPIGTNFAIRVEDNHPSLETYNLQSQSKPTIYNEHDRVPIDESVEDNRWNTSSIEKGETTIVGHHYYHQNVNSPPLKDYSHPSIPPSLNSHANFPMMNEDTTSPPKDLKPVIDYVDTVKFTDQKRPAKLIPNIPTNSHGWYSSALNENNINNIKVEATTRKIIPIHEYNEKNIIPDFGQKITSAGKPPELWTKNQQVLPNFNIGKPFTKVSSTEKPYSNIPMLTIKPDNGNNYIPSNFNAMQQPAYDIPIRDNSDETTTSTHKPKPIYENSEEVYDGEEEQESTYDNDGEVSLESMKIPVVSSSSEIGSSTSSTEITLLQDEVLSPPKDNKNKNKLINFNSGTQTEKPFEINDTASFQSNTIKPVYANNYYNMKPRPFTVNTAMVLDHQLQQPHWQINHMIENSSNVSHEDNVDLNIGEEMNVPFSTKPSSTQRTPLPQLQNDSKYSQPFRPVFTRTNGTQVLNESNIITSTVHIKDKKPLIVEKATEKPTLATFTIKNDIDSNKNSSEIIDLSPPPPTMDYNFKPSTNDEMIMGMSPPPPRNPPAVRLPSRVPLTPRPIPVRSPPPYRPKPQRTLPPRVSTQRPVRKPINREEVSTYRPHIRDDVPALRPIKDQVSTYRPSVRDEISTYRPAYDILHNIRRPIINHEQPSSQLLPPPRETLSKVITPVTYLSSPTISQAVAPNLVFPTPTSSGWLTSSAFDFSSRFNFAPTSIQFPDKPKPSTIQDLSDVSSSESSYSYEVEYSSEKSDELASENPASTVHKSTDSEKIIDSTTKLISSSSETHASDSIADESVEDSTTEKVKIIGHKNRTRKPYPIRNDDRKTTTSKFKLPSKPSTIRPTRTLVRPDIVYPTRHTSIKKIVSSMSTRLPPVLAPSIIESSESSIDEDLIKPTEVLQDSVTPTPQIELSALPKPSSTLSIPTFEVNTSPIIRPVHHAGNEIKISDEPIPTKTEFRTTVITLTKTLSEPPTTISSVDFVNLTHTLTVTHTKTSLVSQSEGAVTETLVLTNTQTSTIVDVVTEIRTQVRPTTIIETVTKHIPVPQVEPTPVQEIKEKTKVPLDDISMSSEENDNLIIRNNEVTENVQKIDVEGDNDNDTFFVVMNKSQNGGQSPPVNTEVETGDYDGITRNEQINSNGVSQVLFGEILLAGAPYLETTNIGNANGGYGKECHPDCKASRNERCQRIDGIMKCVCRPGFARMFPDRPCKPTYTYSVKLALDSQGNKRLRFHQSLSDNSSKEYQALAVATHEGINRMVMQSDLRDVFHGVHITGFHPVEMKETGGDSYQGVMNDFYVQLSDNAHENRLKEVIEKYLRNNNCSLGGTDVHAASELVDRLDVSDFDECTSVQFHDCSEHAQCFNLRGTYTCSCLEGYADLSVNNLYPGRICSTEPVGCEKCNYHGACYSRDDRRVLCECFQWYAGSTCQINLKVVLISLVVAGAVLTAILTACAVVACRRSRPPQRSIVACIQSMPSLHQGAVPSKQRADRRALINERGDAGDASSIQNASLPYMPVKRPSSMKKLIMSEPPAHDPPPPPPAPALMIPRARLHQHHGDSRENISRKRSLELSSEAKLISYLESGASANHEEMRRKHSLESSYSANKDRHNKQGALVSAGFKVSTTIRVDEVMKDDRDDLSSVNKGESDGDIGRFDSLRKSYSQEDLSEWTDAERRLGELTLSEARSVGGTLPASTGRAASSTRLTHQEANTMAERDLGSTFLLPHVHLYKSDITSDVSEFDSL